MNSATSIRRRCGDFRVAAVACVHVFCQHPIAQAAWAASHSCNSNLSAQYRRLAGRRGKKRAIVAVGHTTLVMIYHMLRDGVDYLELRHDYLDKLQPQRLTRYLVKRLESLGHQVTLQPVNQAV